MTDTHPPRPEGLTPADTGAGARPDGADDPGTVLLEELLDGPVDRPDPHAEGRPRRRGRTKRLSATDRLFGDLYDDATDEAETDQAGHADDDGDGGPDTPGERSYAAERGQWEDLKGPTPRGLRRNRFLDQLGWYEVRDREPIITSTRQAIATNPALVRSQPPFSGNAIGVDEETGMYVGSDPFVLYDSGVIESINVVIVGDVGVGKTSLVQNHYVQNQIYAGRRVCTFDRKRNKDTDDDQDKAGARTRTGDAGRAPGQGLSEYDGVARVVEASGRRVTRIRFDRAGQGARVNILDPRIIARGSDQSDTVGQDELLLMVAQLLHGPLNSFEKFALNAAHKQALAVAAAQGRVTVLGDVVDALFSPSTDYLPAALRAGRQVDESTMLGYGLGLAFDLYAALDGELSGLIDGPTRAAGGGDLDLGADLIVVDTSSLQDGSVALMLVMAVMSSFISSVWALNRGQSVVILEEGYSADFPSVASILRTLAKRGRGVGVSLVLVLHHLSDIPPGSAMASLFKETGVIHLLRQAQSAEAQHTNNLLGLGDFAPTIQQLAKGSHILIEGRPESRPPRIITHVRTDVDRWANYSDAAITGGADAPPSPFDAPDTASAVHDLAAPEAPTGPDDDLELLDDLDGADDGGRDGLWAVPAGAKNLPDLPGRNG